LFLKSDLMTPRSQSVASAAGAEAVEAEAEAEAVAGSDDMGNNYVCCKMLPVACVGSEKKI
jgi:hypothetical protein